MALPGRLSRKLRDTLGSEAAEEMVTLMERMQIQIDAIAEHRRDMLGAMQRLDERIQGVEVRLTKEIASVRVDLGERISNVRADLMKWSFMFWVGAVAAIAMLAGILGR